MAVTAKIGTGSAFSFTGFSTGFGILAIDGPDMSLGFDDATKMATTGAKEFMSHNLPDYGSVKITHEWDGITYPTLGTTANVKTLTITAPSLAGGSASAFITGFSPKFPLEGKMTAETTFKISGGWTTST